MIDYWKLFLIVAILSSIGVGADDNMLSQTNLRGSSLSTLPPRNVLEEMANAPAGDLAANETNSHQRKQDLFRARSNNSDDDVIAAYESSNDESSVPQMAPFRTSTPTIDSQSLNTSSSIDDKHESISTGIFHQAPLHPAGSNSSSVKHPHLASTALAPTNNPMTAPTAEPTTLDPLENDPTAWHAPSSKPDYNDNTVVIARYHQEDIIAEANTDKQVQGGAKTSEEPPQPSQSEQDLGSLSTNGNKKSKQIVPALLTGFASMILFFGFYLVCMNQRDSYILRKWEKEELRRVALKDDGSCGRSAYSEPFDNAYGEAIEDGRSLYSRSSQSTKGGEGSEGGGSYWVEAVKKIADKTRNDETNDHRPNILPPLDNGADDDESSFTGLSLVSSLTQSLMTFGSALWPTEEVSLDLGPSSRRVAAQSKRSSVGSSEKESLDGEDSAISYLRQANSKEDLSASGSVCSSLTDGTSATVKSEEFEEAPGGRGSHNGACMPAIDEDGVHDEENRRTSPNSPSMRKDVSSDSFQTQSTVLDDSSSLDLASELARLQNLIGSIEPGDDFCERDMVVKSLSEESFDLGIADGQEEI